MSAERAKRAALAGLAVASLAIAGCGVEEHANEARPPAPTRVTVTLDKQGVTVEPRRVAVGPEPTQQTPQNKEAAQPRMSSDRPLIVTFVASNLTPKDSRLEVRGTGGGTTSRDWVGHGNVTMQASLDTGTYVLTAANVPDAKPARLTVGPYRYSSENELLLP